MVYIRFLVQLTLAIVGLQIVRSLVRRKFPNLQDKYFDTVVILLVIIGGFLLIYDASSRDATERKMAETLGDAAKRTTKIEGEVLEAQKQAEELVRDLAETQKKASNMEGTMADAAERAKDAQENLTKAEAKIRQHSARAALNSNHSKQKLLHVQSLPR